MRLFGRKKLKLDDYNARCIEMFKNEVIQAADDFHAASAKYLTDDAKKRNILDARGPESFYMMAIHVMTNVVGYQLRYSEGRRASDGVINKLFKWVFYAGSFECPPVADDASEFGKLDRGTTDRSITYHNEVLNKNGQLVQMPATLSPSEYLEQKAVPVFNNELVRQMGVEDIDSLNPELVAALLQPIYRIEGIFDQFISNNTIKIR